MDNSGVIGADRTGLIIDPAIPPMQTLGNSLIGAFGLNSDWLLIKVLLGALVMADLRIYIYGP
jgi:hypothetical protein